MGDLMDEGTVWKLLQRIGHRPVTEGRKVRCQMEEGGGPWLAVEPDGTWTASPEPTAGAAGMLDLFIPLKLRKEGVFGQLGQSLDGRIATESGHSHYVTGPQDIVRLHRLRASVDAVLVGAGTVASDDPRLTVREVEGNQPVRVVLDPRGRSRPDRRIFSDGAAETLWLQATAPAAENPAPSVPPGVTVLALSTDAAGRFHPERILSVLRARGLRRILVEGGGVTVSRFLQAGALDRLHVTVAPMIIGSGRPGLELPVIQTLQEALRPPCRRFPLGEDVLFDLDLSGSEPIPARP